ncbi:cytochrome b [Phenylobacterium sp. J367]|uniref:cytochrome b n=1 Tax=Phenylobacterium sp. J367 TaxID=2898435 RepID=UPI002150E06A|nr:cytochrome b [Phenylobacterium sp. J367]MCR5880660.1 cytochrome b [Phenylobacterium sp. J367]
MIDRLLLNVLEWAAGHTDEGRYSPVAIVFHWAMAGLVAFQLGWGWWMGRLPTGGEKAAAYELHYAAGVLMLALIVGRTAWRALAPGPINDADKPGWESVAAKITHYVFYVCLFGLPLSGWLMVSASGRETDLTLAGLIPWPLLPLQDLSNGRLWALEALAEWTHWGLIVTLLLLIPIHVGGALKHQLVDRDDVMHGMLPVLPKPRRKASPWRRRWLALERRTVRLARRLARLSRRPTARRSRSA